MSKMLFSLDKKTIRNIILVCVADGVVGISYGAIAYSQGFDWWIPLVLSIFVIAGSSEFLFIGIVSGGGSPISAAIAGLLVNARHIPYGFAVKDYVGKGAKALLGYHIINDESVVFSMTQPTTEQNKMAFWVCGIGILLCWPLGVICGEFIGTLVPDPNLLGMDAMFPAILIALIAPSLKKIKTLKAALLGGSIVVIATPFLPTGISVLLSLIGILFFRMKK